MSNIMTNISTRPGSALLIVLCAPLLLAACSSSKPPARKPGAAAAATATPAAAATMTVATAAPVTPTATVTADPASSPNGSGPAVFVWRTAGTGMQQLAQPSNIAVDGQNNLYVIDSSHDRVVKYDRNGRFLTAWGSEGSSDGQFVFRRGPGRAGGIAVDAQGAVLVLDAGGRLQRFDANGVFLGKRDYGIGSGNGQFDQPQAMALDRQGNLYVTDAMNNRVQKFDHTGAFVTAWGHKGSGKGEFDFPSKIALDASGKVYVTDFNNHRVQKFDSNGTFLGMWGSEGSGAGQFERVLGIAVDPLGDVYVSDNQPGRIEKFDSSGRFLGQWGSTGSGNGQFGFAGALALDAQGNIYVLGLSSDARGTSDDCVQKFRPR